MRKVSAIILILLAVFAATSVYAVDKIADVKLLPDYTPVTLTGKIATTSSAEIPYTIYVEEPDRSSGIQVRFTTVGYTGVLEGKTVTVSGNMFTYYTGERIIRDGVITPGNQNPFLRPVGMKLKSVGGSAFGFQKGVKNSLGPNNVGLLARVWGKVTASDTSYRTFTLDDGSGSPVQVSTSHLPSFTLPVTGYFGFVTGAVSTKTSGSDLLPVITPRRLTDIKADLETQINTINIDVGKLGIFWLGQGGFLLKDHEGRKIAIDPYLSDYCRLMVGSEWVRSFPVPIAPGKLMPGLTLVTHDHGDHTDPWSLQPIYTSSQSMFCGPTSSYNHLGASDIGVTASRRVTLNRGQTWTWNGITITAVYANHTTDSVGFVINMAGRKLYISGDTLYDTTLVNAVKAQNPNIMLVCINGKLGNMPASEAASLVKACNPQYAIPMHYGMFAYNTADPQTFVTECTSQGVTAQVIVLPNCLYTVL